MSGIMLPIDGRGDIVLGGKQGRDFVKADGPGTAFSDGFKKHIGN